jgi:hypothetical protein
LESGDVLPGGEECLLDGVLSVLGRAEDAVAVQLQFTPVFLDQLGESIRVAGLCPGDQISVDENAPIRVAGAVSPFRLLVLTSRQPEIGHPCPLFRLPSIYLFDREREVSRRNEETTVPRFLFSYRVPKDYQPGAQSRPAWEAWFENLGSSTVDTGHSAIATRTLGTLDAETRLGGYSVVTAEDIDGAAAQATGCPALQLGGGVEIGAVPEFIENPQAETDA